MKRKEAVERVIGLSKGPRPDTLTAENVEALALLLPELTEVAVAWDGPIPPPSDVHRECTAALADIGARHGLRPCDDEGGYCYFPRCLADGCEGDEDTDASPAAPLPSEPSDGTKETPTHVVHRATSEWMPTCGAVNHPGLGVTLTQNPARVTCRDCTSDDTAAGDVPPGREP